MAHYLYQLFKIQNLNFFQFKLAILLTNELTNTKHQLHIITNKCYNNTSSFFYIYFSSQFKVTPESMNQTEIIALLRQTLQASNIKEAEAAILQTRLSPGFVTNLLLIATDAANDLNIRLVAIVTLKTTVDSFYDPALLQKIPEQDKQILRQNILEALIRTIEQPRLIPNFQEIIFTIAYFDMPQRWSSVLPRISETLQNSQDFNALYACLVALKAILSVFSLSADQNRRKYVCHIISQTFSYMQLLASKLIQNFNEKTGTVLLLIMKIFATTTFMEIPPNLKSSTDSLHIWLVFIKTLLDCNLPIDETLLKIRKKCLKILYRFFQRHANPKYDKHYAEYFLNRYGVKLLESMVLQLLAPVDLAHKTKLNNPVMVSFPYLYKYQPCRQLLEHHKAKLINVVIHGALLTSRDLEVWQEDPVEFINKEKEQRKPVTDLIRMYADGPSFVSSQLIEAMKNNAPITGKEILLFLFSELSTQIYRSVDTEILIQIMRAYIIPGITDPSDLIKSRCCQVYDSYKELPLSEADIQLASQNIYGCFVSDCLPIRVSASEAFAGLVEQYDSVANTLKAHVGDILNNYLKLIEMIDSQRIVSSLEVIIAKLADSVEPFAVQLVSTLSNLFFKYCEKEGHVVNLERQQEEEEQEEADQCASNACLATIRQILNCPLPTQCYCSLSVEIYNLVMFILAEKSSNYLEEGLNILNLFLFKSPFVPQPYVSIYPILCYYVTGVPENLQSQNPLQNRIFKLIRQEVDKNIVDNIIGPLRNFIAKLKTQIFNLRDQTGTTFYDLMCKAIQTTKAKNERANLAVLETLYITLIQQMGDVLNDQLPLILSFAITEIKEASSNQDNTINKRLKLINMEIILMALYANPVQVLTLLNSLNMTHHLIELFLQEIYLFKADYEKQRIMLGFIKVLQVDPRLTSGVSNYFGTIINNLVQLSTEVIQAREKDDADESECSEAEVEDTLIFNKQMQKEEESEDVDDDEWEEEYNKLYQSPLESVDEVMYFANFLKGSGSQYLGMLSNLQQEALSQAVMKASSTCKKIE